MKDLILKDKYRLFFLSIILTIICSSLAGFRIYKTNSIVYGFLLWNLFLAWIPYIISLVYLKFHEKIRFKLLNLFIFCTWLLFFPNSPYILTDIAHLVDIRDRVPIWYDLFLILSFAFTGLFVGILSLFNIHTALKKYFNNLNSWFIVFITIFLCSFGVYLGRYQRWNSWDFFTQPITLLKGIIIKMFEPNADITSFGVTGLLTLFITMSYLTFYSLHTDKKQI